MIGAALAEDPVVTRATGQVVTGLRTYNQVVTHATISGNAYRWEQPRISFCRKQRRGVDNIVAVEIEGVS